MAELNAPKVQLLSVPDCPLVKKVRSMLENCLTQTHMNAVVDEVAGDYNSPTLLVDGFDVTGCPAAPEGQTSCRLDLPNEEQIIAAVRTLTVLKCENVYEELVQAAAFQSLLHTGEPVTLGHLVTMTNLEIGTIAEFVERMRRAGRIKLNSEGLIEGAAGLSVSPTNHSILINGRRFWAWCALDVLGVFGALNASGFANSRDPSSGETIELQFAEGVLQDMNFTVFIADLSNGISICREWCPNINFFVSKRSAETWIQANAAKGSAISVGNLVHVSRETWSRYVITNFSGRSQ